MGETVCGDGGLPTRQSRWRTVTKGQIHTRAGRVSRVSCKGQVGAGIQPAKNLLLPYAQVQLYALLATCTMLSNLPCSVSPRRQVILLE